MLPICCKKPKAVWKPLTKVPACYRLLELRIQRDNRQLIIPGWWDGYNWVALRLKKGDKVLEWKDNVAMERGLEYGRQN